MRVTQIIEAKGTGVLSLPPTATVRELIEMLADRRIGAVVITEGEQLVGIASERDVVRYLREGGEQSTPVSEIMTAQVTTCAPEDSVRDLATIMTAKRVRHLPVLQQSRLIAIVSIGDIVKARLDELEAERDHLAGYVHG